MRIYGVTLHPTDPKLYSKIEWGIRPLVKAFHRRGHITLDSCEGHLSLNRSRCITLAFTDKDQLQRFEAWAKTLPEVCEVIPTILDQWWGGDRTGLYWFLQVDKSEFLELRTLVINRRWQTKSPIKQMFRLWQDTRQVVKKVYELY